VTNGIAPGAVIGFVARPAVSAAIVLIGIIAAIAFGRRPGRVYEGLVAVVALTLLSTAHAQLFGSPWRHLFYSGLCLCGWLLGLAFSRRRGAPTDEWFARTGALALLSAAYLNAGISKLVYGGWEWVSALPIQSVVVGQDGLVADGIASMYRTWVVTTPPAAIAFSVATVAFELAAPLMLVGSRARLIVAAGLLAMHANIYVLTDILYWESMVLLAVFGLSGDPPPQRETAQATVLSRSSPRAFVAAAVLLALCAIVAISHQARRYARIIASGAGQQH